MSIVSQLLKTKGNEIWSVAPQATVFEALQIMAEKEIGALLVLDNEKLVGIFSERDYARKLILKDRSSKEATVGEMMTRNVLYVEPETTIDECMALMTEKRVRHLPVMENGQLVGIVTIGDVVKKYISDQEFMIQQLEKYISGKY